VAREALLVEYEDLGSGGFQALGRSGAGGAAADNDDFDTTHCAAYFGYMKSRVSGMALFFCFVNST